MQQTVFVLLDTSSWCVCTCLAILRPTCILRKTETAAASDHQQNAWAEERRIRGQAQWTIIEKTTSTLTDFNSNTAKEVKFWGDMRLLLLYWKACNEASHRFGHFFPKSVM